MFGVRARSVIIVGLILIFLSIPVSAQVIQKIGKYTVYANSSNDNDTSIGLAYTGGAQNTVTFWELPLWIQVSVLSSGLIALLLSLPLVFGVIKKLQSRSKALLDNPRRNTIYDYVKKNPGVHMASIVSKLKMNLGTFRYHLQVLNDRKLVTIMHDGKYIRIFPNASSIADVDKVILANLNNETKRKIIKTVIENPGINATFIADNVGMSLSNTMKYTRQLNHDGLITNEHQFNNSRYYINKEIQPNVSRLLYAKAK
jgi:predicted transcriptional regulator